MLVTGSSSERDLARRPTAPGMWPLALHAAEPGYHGDPHGAEIDPALDAIRATDVIAAVDKLLDATSHQSG